MQMVAEVAGVKAEEGEQVHRTGSGYTYLLHCTRSCHPQQFAVVLVRQRSSRVSFTGDTLSWCLLMQLLLIYITPSFEACWSQFQQDYSPQFKRDLLQARKPEIFLFWPTSVFLAILVCLFTDMSMFSLRIFSYTLIFKQHYKQWLFHMSRLKIREEHEKSLPTAK